MKIDVTGLSTILSWVGMAAVFILVSWLAWRKGQDIVLRRAAEEWQSLSNAQEKRIKALEGEMASVLSENRELKKINSNLMSLNLELQAELHRCRGEAPARRSRTRTAVDSAQ